MKIYLDLQSKNHRINILLNQLNIQHNKNSLMALRINKNRLELYDRYKNIKSFITIDFNSKKNNYRCNQATIKKEILAKAIGIKKNFFPLVVDATAGLGRDSFLLSYLGCTVIMVERNPIIAALLQDGLERAYQDKKNGLWIKERLYFLFKNSFNMLTFPTLKPDVVYLDPMYPIRKKKCLPKKEMQFFQKLIGQDLDADELLIIARKYAKKRIVVKRPYYAQPLSKKKADFIIWSKNHRFDIYYPFKKK